MTMLQAFALLILFVIFAAAVCETVPALESHLHAFRRKGGPK